MPRAGWVRRSTTSGGGDRGWLVGLCRGGRRGRGAESASRARGSVLNGWDGWRDHFRSRWMNGESRTESGAVGRRMTDWPGQAWRITAWERGAAVVLPRCSRWRRSRSAGTMRWHGASGRDVEPCMRRSWTPSRTASRRTPSPRRGRWWRGNGAEDPRRVAVAFALRVGCRMNDVCGNAERIGKALEGR